MVDFIYILVPVLTVLLIRICEKNKILVDFKKENHKRFASKIYNYSIAGIIFYLFWLYIFISENNYNLIFFQVFSLIFFTGLFSDLKIFRSAKFRFLLQIIILLYFIFISDFKIPLSNIHLVDIFLSNQYFNKFFTIFCLMILINGNNFIDGINTLLIGYNVTISIFLLFLFDYVLHDPELLKNYLYILLILLFFNLKGKIILGDSGSYALAFFLGVYLINFAANNPYLSPFFIISLLWYPCFETLFSIIRRLKYNKKTYNPDTKHLHQLFYSFFLKKFKKNEQAHFMVSLSINSYCLIILFLNYLMGYKTLIIVLFLIGNVSIYMILYRYLNKKNKN